MNQHGPFTIEKNTIFAQNDEQQIVFSQQLQRTRVYLERENTSIKEEGEKIDRKLTSLVALGTEKGRFMIGGTEKGEICVYDEQFGNCADIIQAHGKFE